MDSGMAKQTSPILMLNLAIVIVACDEMEKAL